MRRFSLFILAVLVFQVLWLVIVFNTTSFQSNQNERTCDKSPPSQKTTTGTTLPGSPTGTRNDCSPTAKLKQEFFLVVLVLTSMEGRERRDCIRSTWTKEVHHLTPTAKVLFSIGTHDLYPEQMATITDEQDQYKDMLLLPDLKESYYNLTRKVLWSFVRIDQEINFKYLIKCDDDTFIKLDQLLKELSDRTSQESLYWGFFDGRATAKKKGKWAEKDWYLCDRYLPYALGGGYVLSGDLVHRVAVNADGLQLYIAEDVSVGAWVSSFRGERRHDVRFNTEFVSRGCREEYLVSHKQSVADMQSKFSNLQTTGRQCHEEYQTRLSYEYNWEVLPSLCCKRNHGIP